MSNTLAHTLRTATQEAHERIERRLAPYFEDESVEGYRSLLTRWYGFLKPWEHHIPEHLSPELRRFFNERRKLDLLAADLRTLGLTESALDDLPVCPDLPDIRSTSGALGSFYVIEGSTLGGKILAKRLLRGGVIPEDALRFYLCYGDEVGARWRDFQEVLSAHHCAGNESEIVSAAVATFESMDRWLAPRHYPS